ncbi:MAG: HEAT repeat domain-containing protein [Planctomycetales bacterium]|nr:HEAT repeat domain-containing protein [Planctomycetales bacterium]
MPALLSARHAGRPSSAVLLTLLVAVGAGSAGAVELEKICRYAANESAAAAASDDETARVRKYAPDRLVDVLHIKLDVTPDFRRRSIAGTATLRFAPIAKPLHTLRLDAVDLDVTAVRSSQAVKDFAVDRESLTIVFAEPVPVDAEAWVEIDYSAEPKKGLYFRTREMGFREEDEHLWSQGEPHEARHWYPAFDYPNEKSSTEVLLHVPADMTALSNGRLLGETTDEAGGLKTVHWRQDKPHANYLLCVVAGRLAKLEKQLGDLPLAFFTQPSLAEHAANSFADTADIIDFYQQETGVKYPWDKYYQSTISDFMWGGMENTSLTTLTQETLFDDATENVYTSRDLDAHETAHQWFGNYVTCKDWSHLWLNEGFATFYTLLYEGHKSGRDAMLYGLYTDARDRVLPQGDDRRPIVYRQYRRPFEQFDFRAYPKGSWVLHMLRSQLGDELYRRSIHSYLGRHAWGAVETEDLRESFEDVTGRTLDRFFDQWVYHAGHPKLKVSFKWLADEQLGHVHVEQEKSTDAAAHWFDFPVTLRFVVDGKTIDEDVEIDDHQHDFYVRLPGKPQIVRFDPDYSVLAEVEFDKPDAMLIAQLGDQSDVIGRVLACAALGKRKTAKSIAALKEALNNDPFFGVREEAAEALYAIRTDESFAALLDSRAQPDARVRHKVVQMIGRNYRPEAREAMLDVAANDANPALVASAIRALGKHGGPEVHAAIRTALASETFGNEPVGAAFQAIERLHDPALQADVIATLTARRDELRPAELELGLRALAAISDDDAHRDAAFDLLASYLTHPRDQLKRLAVDSLGQLGDERARAILEPLAVNPDGDRLAQAAADALEKLDEDVPAPPEEVAELRKQLRELKKEQEKLAATVKELRGKDEASGEELADESAKDETASAGGGE